MSTTANNKSAIEWRTSRCPYNECHQPLFFLTTERVIFCINCKRSHALSQLLSHAKACAPPESTSTAIAHQPLADGLPITVVQQTVSEPVEPLNPAAVRLLDEEYFYMPQHLQQQYWQMRLREVRASCKTWFTF